MFTKEDKSAIPRYLRICADYFELHPNSLTGGRGSRTISEARQVSMHVARKLFNLTLVQVAEIFQRRAHRTVLHAIAKVDQDARLLRQSQELSMHIRNELQPSASRPLPLP